MANLFTYFDGALPRLFTEKHFEKGLLREKGQKITRNLEKGPDMAQIRITLKNKKYHSVRTVLKSNRETKKTTMSEHF